MWKETLIALGLSASPADHPPVACLGDCAVSEDGAAFVKEWEGFYPYIYKDSAGYDTVGFGHLVRPGEKIKTPLMGEDAEKLFKSDIAPAVKAVNKRVQTHLFQAQADSLISFTFNLGSGALQSSTLLKRVNEAKHDEVPIQFLRWNKVNCGTKAGCKVIPGLTRRREAEAQLYRQKVY